ncbi:beta-galactosidase [Pengzhenrongella sp.]|jgi:beta-galactosidase|uniref:beta-galactosidase n=1 Tax=Pengzhenrongella sp. TaxID=2888820 RepID=UPI002F936B27
MVHLTPTTANVTPQRETRPDRPGLDALTRELGLLYGCDYNPEQWPREVWREDVALMRAAGVNLVTVGVFSWALLEPRHGELDLDWLGDVLDLMHSAGIAVDLATPTASPPAWLGLRSPEVRAVNADGVRLSHGSRNHFCPSSPVYRAAALRIAGALLDRFGDHPAVRMWHIGNEYGQVCHCDLCGGEFQAWLRRRYGTVESLNTAWGTTFWSQRYDDWSEIVPPRAAPYLINPTQNLDFSRFASDQLLALYVEQRDLVRRAAPGVPVTTNFMGFHPLTDYWRWAPEVDVVADDAYPDPADPDSPVRQSLAHDLMRGLAGGTAWMLLEQAASAVNWREHNLPKTPARMRLDSLRAIARGADGSCYFQWRQSAFGAERFHSALVPHAGPDTRLHRAVVAHGAELRRLGALVGARVEARAALVFDWSSWWAAHEPAGPSRRLAVMDQVLAYYRPLWRAGIAVDVVHPGGDLSGYDLVVAPQLYLVTDDDAANLRGVVERGGVLLLGPFSGVADADAHIRLGRFPVPFADLVGGSGEEFCPLPDGGVPVTSGALGDFTATVWGERLRVDDGEAVASYAGADLDGSPAVLRRRSAAGGAAWYVGTIPPLGVLEVIVARCAAAAGLNGALAGSGALPDGVEAVRRGDVLFLLNTAAAERSVPLAGTHRDLLTGEVHPGTVRLRAEGAVALVEGSP